MVLLPVKAFMQSIGKQSENDGEIKLDFCLTDLLNISPSEVRQIHDWLVERLSDLSSGVSI